MIDISQGMLREVGLGRSGGCVCFKILLFSIKKRLSLGIGRASVFTHEPKPAQIKPL
jgi:hypothetical protein